MNNPAAAPSIDAGPQTIGDSPNQQQLLTAPTVDPTTVNPQWTDPNAPLNFTGNPTVGPTGNTAQLQDVQLTDMPQQNFNIQQPTAGQSFMMSPWGQFAQTAIPGMIGLYGARQQQNLGNQIAGTIPAAVQPATTLGRGISTQLQGGGQMPGPYGASIAQQTGAAAQLGNVAQQYASGNLTPAQQLALQQGVNAATAQKNLAFSMSGNPLSSASIMEGQNINNQAIIASQQIQQNNIALASNALQSVQGVYNNLVSQVITSAGLGGVAANAAAQLIMKNNVDVQKQITSIWANIAKSILGAQPGQQGGQTNNVVGQMIDKLLGKNQPGAVNPQQPGQPTPQPGQQMTDTSNLGPVQAQTPSQQFDWLGNTSGTSGTDSGVPYAAAPSDGGGGSASTSTGQ
jgi:hypothetical protein